MQGGSGVGTCCDLFQSQHEYHPPSMCLKLLPLWLETVTPKADGKQRLLTNEENTPKDSSDMGLDVLSPRLKVNDNIGFQKECHGWQMKRSMGFGGDLTQILPIFSTDLKTEEQEYESFPPP